MKLTNRQPLVSFRGISNVQSGNLGQRLRRAKLYEQNSLRWSCGPNLIKCLRYYYVVRRCIWALQRLESLVELWKKSTRRSNLTSHDGGIMRRLRESNENPFRHNRSQNRRSDYLHPIYRSISGCLRQWNSRQWRHTCAEPNLFEGDLCSLLYVTKKLLGKTTAMAWTFSDCGNLKGKR
jgi:hypothetical protein